MHGCRHGYGVMESLEELGRLADTAGLEVVGHTYQMLDEVGAGRPQGPWAQCPAGGAGRRWARYPGELVPGPCVCWVPRAQWGLRTKCVLAPLQ